jgi:S1-C subfamily serine protease
MKIKSKFIFFILVFIIGGFGAIIINRSVFPYLASTKPFSDVGFFKKISDQVTVINRTEQVYLKEEFSLEKVVAQTSSSAVEIVIFSNSEIFIKNSGVVATSDGIIITYLDPAMSSNSGSLKYKVIASDGKAYDAEFLGLDSYSNLAFLKISAGNLTVVPFANSNDAVSGEKIVAIGASSGKNRIQYASGLLSKIDAGYNLAGKTVSSSEKLEGVFEADFNLKNDFIGGPAADYSGQVIGLVGSIKKDNAQDFFIIPANKVKSVMERAIKKELNTNPALGLYYIPLFPDYSAVKNISRDRGALVYSPSGQRGLAVISGTPADKAGIQINDIIVSINGEEINSENTLPDLLYKYKKGQEIEVGLVRDGKDAKIKVQL